MNCEYVRQYYGVPAEIGRRIIHNGKPGIIAEDRGHYIGVNFDKDEPGVVFNVHPTDHVEYLETGKVRSKYANLSKKKARAKERYQEYLDSETDLSFAEYIGADEDTVKLRKRLGLSRPEPFQLRAFQVSCDDHEASVLVFARKASKAKSMAFHDDAMTFVDDFTDLSCRRISAADYYAKEFGEGCLPLNERGMSILRELGWYQIDGNMEPCTMCNLYEWDSLSDSRIDESGLCSHCRTVLNVSSMPALAKAGA